jgi:hypothetical protein
MASLRRDGMQLTILWSNILLPDNSILNIGLDITERKKQSSNWRLKRPLTISPAVLTVQQFCRS